MTVPVVELQDVHRSFGGGVDLHHLMRLRMRRRPVRQILRGVSLDAGPGEWTAVMGANGSGKTTTLKMVAGLVRAEAGTVRVNGVDVRDDPAMVRRLVGYSLADERSFQWRLTARQNLAFFAQLEGLRGQAMRDRVDLFLRDLDLWEQRDRPFGEFSSGIRQRLAIARALIARPQILLLDEPTRSLDAHHAAQAWTVIHREIEDAGGIVLLATHRPEEAREHCHRLWILRDGIFTEDKTHGEARLAGRGGATGLAIVARGLRPAAIEALRAMPGVERVETITIRAGEQVTEIVADGRDGALASILRLLARHGGAIESVQEHVVLPTETRATERQAV